MTVSATNVPSKFDCIINGEGYLFAPSDAGLPPSVFGIKPEFSYTPTFVQRQNTSGDFGDNQQDFWLTATQRDWSLGEQQRYFHQSDEDAKRRYWRGEGLDIQTPGQVSMRPDIAIMGGLATNATGISELPIGANSTQSIVVGTATKLYTLDDNLTLTDRGVHGLGATPSLWGITTDLQNAYVSTTSAGTVGVRKWTGAAYSTFSATGADSLCFLNNTLYGLCGAAGTLVRYDTAGAATVLFTWKDSAGTAISLGTASKLFAFGGKLGILRAPAPNSLPGTGAAELWFYDGTAPAIAWQLPPAFNPFDVVVSLGTIFISGSTPSTRRDASGNTVPTILFYASGTPGRLWRGDVGTSNPPGMAPFGDGMVFSDQARLMLMFYDPAVGGTSTMAYTGISGQMVLGCTGKTLFGVGVGTTNAVEYQGVGNIPLSASATTSLFDFDSSLTKLVRGIRVEFDSATDGNGGTVDIAYRVGDVDGSYTTLQTGATSGTEYTLSGVTGRSVSVKVTLNKGTSTAGPVLKRVSVRAAPQQTTFRQGKYVLYLGGSSKRTGGESQMVSLRDGTTHRKDGAAMAANIITAATSATPISVTDGPNGTISSVVCDLSNFQLAQIKPGEYVCVFPWREV